MVYPSAPEALKTDLRTMFSQLCQDDTPMVRKSAASNLGKFASFVEVTHLKTFIMPIFEDLIQDGMSNICTISNFICVVYKRAKGR